MKVTCLQNQTFEEKIELRVINMYYIPKFQPSLRINEMHESRIQTLHPPTNNIASNLTSLLALLPLSIREDITFSKLGFVSFFSNSK